MTYYSIRNHNLAGQLNPFRATPALFELLSELSVVLAMQASLDPTSYSQMVIQYD